MREKQNSLQLELFSGSKDALDIKNPAANNSFLNFIWNYEKIILIIIGVITTSIISFSLGVEKGKRLSMQKADSRLDMALSVIPKVEDQLLTIKKEKSVYGYTIQLASYKTKTYAQKEARVLKGKGLLPLILSKGDYIILCVGHFSKKETAQPLLSELKKRYQGCYVRRL